MDQPPEQSNQPLTEPTVLVFETSPFGTLDAIVQHDGKSIYFYLNESRPEDSNLGRQNSETPLFGTRACWVRNLEIGPLVLNETEMRQGISPMLPRTHGVHREGQPILDADRLQIVWFEEGNGAALIETGHDQTEKTLAVIPPWSGLEGFHGYAAECAIECPICWPLPDNPNLQQRINRAREFWLQWRSSPDPFAQLQPKVLAAYDAAFGPAPQEYFSIDGGGFPPRGLVRYKSADEVILATVGMSTCPQPAVEIFTDDPSNHRRIELAIRLKGDFLDQSVLPRLEQLATQLSGLASYPWRRFTWLGSGHTCGIADPTSDCNSALLLRGDQLSQSQSSAVDLPTFRDDPIQLLWLVPITTAQQQQLENKTLTVDGFLQNNV